MTCYLDLPIGDGTPELITAVIEIPQGGINFIQAAHNRYRERNAAA